MLLGSAFALVWRPVRGDARAVADEGPDLFDVFALLPVAVLGWMVLVDSISSRSTAPPASLFRGGLFLVGLAMLVLIAAVSHGGAFAGRLLGIRPLVWIGLRSYGLYLFHWPIFMIIRGVAGNPMSVRAVRDRDGRHRVRHRAVVPVVRDADPDERRALVG